MIDIKAFCPQIKNTQHHHLGMINHKTLELTAGIKYKLLTLKISSRLSRQIEVFYHEELIF